MGMYEAQMAMHEACMWHRLACMRHRWACILSTIFHGEKKNTDIYNNHFSPHEIPELTAQKVCKFSFSLEHYPMPTTDISTAELLIGCYPTSASSIENTYLYSGIASVYCKWQYGLTGKDCIMLGEQGQRRIQRGTLIKVMFLKHMKG